MKNTLLWDNVCELIQDIYEDSNKENDSNPEIEPDTKIMDDLEFDSLAVMELLTKIEEQFGVDFTDLDDFEERFNRCGDLYEGILELLEEK